MSQSFGQRLPLKEEDSPLGRQAQIKAHYRDHDMFNDRLTILLTPRIHVPGTFPTSKHSGAMKFLDSVYLSDSER